jgi:hypothetical protein
MNPVLIAESSAGGTKDSYDNFKYRALTSEYRRQHKLYGYSENEQRPT